MADDKMTNRQFFYFMWISLFNEQRGWDKVLETHVDKRVKQLFNNYNRTAAMLEAELGKHIDFVEVSDDSEVFSRCIELIRNTKDVEGKKNLYATMVYYLQEHERQELLKSNQTKNQDNGSDSIKD